MRRRGDALTWLLIIAVGLVWVLNVCGGAKWYSPANLVEHTQQLTNQIFWTLRVPRGLCALCVGAMLAISGQLMQALARNPIADPSLLGVNAGANLALMLGALAGLSLTVVNIWWLSLIGAFVAFIVVMGLAMSRRGIDPLRFVLGGTVFSGFVTCLTYAVGLLTNSTSQFRNLLVGGFSGANAANVKLALVGLVGILVVIMSCRKSLNLLVLDDATAQSLGAHPGITRIVASLLIVVAAGLSVAIAGNIGFIGLGIPQVIKLLHPTSFERNVLPTMLAGGMFMLLADLAAKTLAAPTELPLSALSGILGGIFLFVILARRQVTTR